MRVIDAELTGTGLVLASALAFGVMPVLAKFVYAAGGTPIVLLIIRFAVAVLLLWGWFVLRGRGVHLPRDRAIRLLGVGVIFSGYSLSAFYAYTRLPAGTVGLLLYVYPAVVVVINRILGERFGMVRWLAVGLAVVGCWLTIGGAPAGADPIGLALALLSGVSFAVYVVTAARTIQALPALEATAMIVLGTLGAVWIAGLASGSVQIDLSLDAWILALITAVVSSPFAMVLFLAGAQRLGASRAALIATVEPIITVVAGFVLLGEWLTVLQGIGAFLILGAVVSQHLVGPPTGRREPARDGRPGERRVREPITEEVEAE